MSISNFYNAMGTMYLDLGVFGTSAMLIYEDYHNVIRCFTSALGEFYIGHSSSHKVDLFARKFTYTVRQCIEEFGLENCSDRVQTLYNQGNKNLLHEIPIVHLIEPNYEGRKYGVSERFRFRECYWEEGGPLGTVLRKSGFFEMPGAFPRWELTGNDAYGTSPAMDALGDVIQLQHETKQKGKSLDFMVNPPMLADVTLKNKPLAMVPRGVTYVQSVANQGGAKPVYQVTPPLQEMTLDIREVQGRIRETFHNDLFRMISQLETVRSAAEIYERKEEKLVLLGPVLERFEHEALDPCIKRIYEIMGRANLLPPAPQSLEGQQVEVQYVSILDAAQNATAAIPVERWFQMLGNVAAVRPEALDLPDWDEMLRHYGESIGVRAKDIRDPQAVQAEREQRAELTQAREASVEGQALVDSAKTLGETDVGGAKRAIQEIIGG